jgi:hypothetical protein
MSKKKNEFLSRKDRRHYSRLIASKLETLGVKDQLDWVQFKTRTGQLVTKRYVDEAGKLVFEGGIGKLSNPARNLVRRLRRLPRDVVQTFLTAKVGQDKASQ